MDDNHQSIIGSNRIKDLQWLCSLSDSELDLLISLKCLAIQRAKKIGHVGLAGKFDLSMLRALSFVLMENLKDQFNGFPSTIGSSEGSSFLSCCNLLRCDPDDTFANMGIEDLKAYICSGRKKRKAEL